MLNLDTACATTTTTTTDASAIMSLNDAVDQLDFPTLSYPLQQQNQDVDFDSFKSDAQAILDDDDGVPMASPHAVITTTTTTTGCEDTPTILDNNGTNDLATDNGVANSCRLISTNLKPNGVEGQSDTRVMATEMTTLSALENNSHRPRFVSPKDFELLKVIGMGAFGKVVQVRNKCTQRILAMKIISKRLLYKKGSSIIDNVLVERNILQRIGSHPFIVTMHCSFQTREKLFIIMDFLAGGELFLRLGREGIFLEKTVCDFYVP
jgi:Protein kinase domain